jgi:hypothetical protein
VVVEAVARINVRWKYGDHLCRNSYAEESLFSLSLALAQTVLYLPVLLVGRAVVRQDALEREGWLREVVHLRNDCMLVHCL